MTLDMRSMQAAQIDTMNDTVYVQRLTKISDETGGYSQTWSTVATTTGRIAPRRMRELEVAGKITSLQEYVITLPANTAVTEKDRLQIDGKQYEIVGIERRTAQTALRINCMEVQ